LGVGFITFGKSGEAGGGVLFFLTVNYLPVAAFSGADAFDFTLLF